MQVFVSLILLFCYVAKKFYLCGINIKIMVLEVKEITQDNIMSLLDRTKKKPRKTLGDIYGKLKRGIDGLEYQKMMRND